MTRLVLFLVLMVAAGCDKLPWASKQEPEAAATASLSAASVTPAPPHVPLEETLAIVNGVPISTRDFEAQLELLKTLYANANRPWDPTPQFFEEMLNGLIDSELMSQDAVARGLDRSTDVQRRWAIVRRGFFAQEWQRWSQERLAPTQEDIQAFYDQNKLGFRKPERRQLRELVVATEDQAKQELSRLLSGTAEFTSLAREVSLGPTKDQGGVLDGWVVRAHEKPLAESWFPGEQLIDLDAQREAAAFAIDHENGLSSIVKGSDNRYHIFQLVRLQQEEPLTLLNVSEWITATLRDQKAKEAVSALEAKAKIERYLERLPEASSP